MIPRFEYGAEQERKTFFHPLEKFSKKTVHYNEISPAGGMKLLPARHRGVRLLSVLRRLRLPLLCLLMLQAIGSVSSLQAAEFVLIANQNLPVNQLKKQEVQNIFLGRSKTVQGVRVQPVMLKNKELTARFLQQEIGKTPVQFTSYYRKIIFTGRGRPPHETATEDDMISYVQATPGAIGYIYANTVPESIKILQVTE